MSDELHDIDRILDDPAWTRRVISAAAMAHRFLLGPNPTADGDDPAMSARSALNTAFMDEKALRKTLEELQKS